MHENSAENMVRNLQDVGVLHTHSIIDAFLSIDRKEFVPEDAKEIAYIDEALPIGEGQTISQPYTVAYMLEMLQPRPGDTVMDVGAGSGWQSTLLAHIVSQEGKKGKVYSFEIISSLCEFGRNNVLKYNFFKKSIVVWQCKDAFFGLESVAPFDRIISAAALSCDQKDVLQCVPSAWKEQLRVGGVMVLPIGNSLWRFVKKGRDTFDAKEHPGFIFVPYIKSS